MSNAALFTDGRIPAASAMMLETEGVQRRHLSGAPGAPPSARSRLLRTPSDQVAVIPVLNGHFLCQFVRIALIIGRGKPPLYFDTPTKNGEPLPEVIAAMSANAAITACSPVTSGSRRGCFPFSPSTWHSSSARRHVVMQTAEHCDSEERVTCESG
jgi:hypothetical protein